MNGKMLFRGSERLARNSNIRVSSRQTLSCPFANRRLCTGSILKHDLGPSRMTSLADVTEIPHGFDLDMNIREPRNPSRQDARKWHPVEWSGEVGHRAMDGFHALTESGSVAEGMSSAACASNLDRLACRQSQHHLFVSNGTSSCT